MKKEISQTEVRKRTVQIFCKKFIKNFDHSSFLSIADLEVKAVKALGKFVKDKSISEIPTLQRYLKDFSLSAQTLGELYRAGYKDIVKLSYQHHGKFYNTEHHAVLNEKLNLNC